MYCLVENAQSSEARGLGPSECFAADEKLCRKHLAAFLLPLPSLAVYRVRKAAGWAWVDGPVLWRASTTVYLDSNLTALKDRRQGFLFHYPVGARVK